MTSVDRNRFERVERALECRRRAVSQVCEKHRCTLESLKSRKDRVQSEFAKLKATLILPATQERQVRILQSKQIVSELQSNKTEQFEIESSVLSVMQELSNSRTHVNVLDNQLKYIADLTTKVMNTSENMRESSLSDELGAALWSIEHGEMVGEGLQPQPELSVQRITPELFREGSCLGMQSGGHTGESKKYALQQGHQESATQEIRDIRIDIPMERGGKIGVDAAHVQDRGIDISLWTNTKEYREILEEAHSHITSQSAGKKIRIGMCEIVERIES